MTVKLKTNGTTHSCEVCVHRTYCEQNEDTLLSMAKLDVYYKDMEFIPIPNNCPILKNPTGKPVKVIFT